MQLRKAKQLKDSLESIEKTFDEYGDYDFEADTAEISCKSYIVYENKTGQILAGKNYDTSLEIASITKVMTTWVTLQVLNKLQINCKKILTRVSRKAASIRIYPV